MKPSAACLFALLAAPVALAAPPEPKTPTTPGHTRPDGISRLPSGTRGVSGQVYVGEAAPGFELTSAQERSVKLSGFIGTRVLLCFAERRESLSEYRALSDSLLRAGVQLVGIARDSPRSLRQLAERDSLPFELLSDPTGQISAMYGSYDFGTATIRPGYVLVDRTSVVRMALLGQSLPADDLLRITRYALIGL